MATLFDALPATTLSFIQAQKERDFRAGQAELERQAQRRLQDSRIAAQIQQQRLANQGNIDATELRNKGLIANTAAQGAAQLKVQEASNTGALERQNSQNQANADAAALARSEELRDRKIASSRTALKNIMERAGPSLNQNELRQAQYHLGVLAVDDPNNDFLAEAATSLSPDAMRNLYLPAIVGEDQYTKLSRSIPKTLVDPGALATAQVGLAARQDVNGKPPQQSANSIADFYKNTGIDPNQPIEQQTQAAQKLDPAVLGGALTTLLQSNPEVMKDFSSRPMVNTDNPAPVVGMEGDRAVIGLESNQNYFIDPVGGGMYASAALPPNIPADGLIQTRKMPMTVGGTSATDPEATALRLRVPDLMQVISAASQTTNPNAAVAAGLNSVETALNDLSAAPSDVEREQIARRMLLTSDANYLENLIAQRTASASGLLTTYDQERAKALGIRQADLVRPYENSKAVNDAIAAESLSATNAQEIVSGESGRMASVEKERAASARKSAIEESLTDGSSFLYDLLSAQGEGFFDPEFGEAYKETRQLGGPGQPRDIADEFFNYEATPGSLKQAVVDSVFLHGAVYGEKLGFGKKIFEKYTPEQKQEIMRLAVATKGAAQSPGFLGQLFKKADARLGPKPTDDELEAGLKRIRNRS